MNIRVMVWLGLAAAAVMTSAACSDDGGSTQTGSGAASASAGGSGPGGGSATGACGGPGQACEQSCTGLGADGDCQGCATSHCVAETAACTADGASATGCLGCAELLLSGTGDPSQLCGVDGDGCQPDSSCARFLALGLCMCGSI